jgi:CRISPR-associated protein Csb2
MTAKDFDAAAGPLPTVARYVVASRTPPRLTETVAVAEKVREALQSLSDGAEVFSGKSARGKPLAGHGHAFVLCEADAQRGRLRHVTVYAAIGFDDPARQAFARLARVWGFGGEDLHLVLAGIGRPEDFAGRDVAAGKCPLLDSSRVWVSHTPFVPTRFAKATHPGEPKLDGRGLQIGCPEHDLRRLIADRFPDPVGVAPLRETLLGGKRTPWSAFHTRRRRGGGRRSTAAGYGFRVEFLEPVRGPIAVGYGAHFGLGTFTSESPS